MLDIGKREVDIVLIFLLHVQGYLNAQISRTGIDVNEHSEEKERSCSTGISVNRKAADFSPLPKYGNSSPENDRW